MLPARSVPERSPSSLIWRTRNTVSWKVASQRPENWAGVLASCAQRYRPTKPIRKIVTLWRMAVGGARSVPVATSGGEAAGEGVACAAGATALPHRTPARRAGNAANQRKHGAGFESAAHVVADPD